jgi:multiple sugar transport system substrate-binding protein
MSVDPERRRAESSMLGKRTTRRKAVGWASGATAAVAAGVGGIGAPSTAFAASAVQSGPIELTYWHGWTEQWEEMVQSVVDMFHAKQDRIRIQPQVVPSEQLLTKLTAAIAAGNPPDIVTLFGSTAIPTLANEDAIIPLNGLEGVDLAAIEDWMDPNILRLGQYQENLYGLSYWAGCYALIYNTRHFTEAGLDPAMGPATIAELDSLADTLTQRQDNGNIDRMGFLPTDYQFWLWGTVFGGSFFDYDNQRVTANDPKLVEALSWYQSYAEKYDPRKVAAFNEGLASERAQQQDPLLSGKFSMQIQGPWKLGDIKLFGEGFEYDVVPPPRATEEGPLSNWTWGDIQIIPRGSKDPSAAAEFVQFTAGVNDPEGYAERVVWGNRPINIPVSSAVLENPAFQEVVNNYPGFQSFIDSLLNAERVGSPPVMPAAALYSDRLMSAIEQVMLLQTEPQAALDRVAAEVQRELDR